MLSPLRRWRSRKMRWAVRWLKNAGPFDQLFIFRHRNHRRSLHLLAKHRRELAALCGEAPFQAPMVRGDASVLRDLMRG